MNRRELLGSAGALSLLPAAGLFAGMPDAGALPALDVSLRLGPVQKGAGNHRWAEVTGGIAAGRLLRGPVRSGRMDWHVDPATGAAELALSCTIRSADGRFVELRDRTCRRNAGQYVALPGHGTAPELSDAADGSPVGCRPLAGRLDMRQLSGGMARLQAFTV